LGSPDFHATIWQRTKFRAIDTLHVHEAPPIVSSGAFWQLGLGSFQQPKELCCRKEQGQQSQTENLDTDHFTSPLRSFLSVDDDRRVGSIGCVRDHKKTEYQRHHANMRVRNRPLVSRTDFVLR
jgi:hypothetical protein